MSIKHTRKASMLSVAQAAQRLGVSSARVRALIASDLLPAQKVGRAWLVREEDVALRKASSPKPGRPKRGQDPQFKLAAARAKSLPVASSASLDYHALYSACKEASARIASVAPSFSTDEEAAFFEAVGMFFSQR